MTHLPGQSVSVQDDEWGTKCASHPAVDAVKRICTESDSFGSEYANLCQTCCDERERAIKDKEEDPEQWETCKCGNREPCLISYRDMDEGMHGPVYEHCSKCHEKMNARIAKELDDEPDYPDYYNADDFIDRWEDDEPEPHYENLVENEFQIVADFLKREYQLSFAVKKTHSEKTSGSELSLVLEVKGNKAYKRINRRFQSFTAIDVCNGLIDVAELKDTLCDFTGDGIEVVILNRRVSDRKIEYRKAKPPIGFFDMVKLIKEGKRRRPSRNTTRHYVTPVYVIEIILAKVYY